MSEPRQDDLVLHDLLSLVIPEGEMPTIERVTRWTNREKGEAEAWAGKAYLRASDNHVRVPDRPSFLRSA